MEQHEQMYLQKVQSYIDSEIERITLLQKSQLREARSEGLDFSMSNPYGAEKIPLSEAYAVSLFYHYGTKVVMPDLIFKKQAA